MLQIVAASVPAVIRARFTLIAAVADLAGVFGSKSFSGMLRQHSFGASQNPFPLLCRLTVVVVP
jgi:hypothetical protein